MKSLKVVLSAAIIALSSLVISNVASAQAHMKGKAYLSPYFVMEHGKKVAKCKKKGYVVVWNKRKQYCVPKHRAKNYFQNKGYKTSGALIWTMHNGRRVAACKPGYKLIKKPGHKPECKKVQNQQQPIRLNNKYDRYLTWDGYKAVCKKGQFWHEKRGHKNLVHCSK